MDINHFIIPLDWDTKQLGVSTAKINSDFSELSSLSQILSAAKSQNIKLIFWQTENTPEHLQTAINNNGILVDHKITYLMALDKSGQTSSENINSENIYQTELYQEKSASPDLIRLAYDSGKFSRFREDPKITEKQFQSIYQEWINNSVNHSIASDIIIIREKNNNTIIGMATVGEKNQRGDIGLLAVAEKARGKNIGTLLVKAAQDYFMQKNYAYSQVVTQQKNIPACKLYEKCGYHIEKVELFFHFWL